MAGLHMVVMFATRFGIGGIVTICVLISMIGGGGGGGVGGGGDGDGGPPPAPLSPSESYRLYETATAAARRFDAVPPYELRVFFSKCDGNGSSSTTGCRLLADRVPANDVTALMTGNFVDNGVRVIFVIFVPFDVTLAAAAAAFAFDAAAAFAWAAVCLRVCCAFAVPTSVLDWDGIMPPPLPASFVNGGGPPPDELFDFLLESKVLAIISGVLAPFVCGWAPVFEADAVDWPFDLMRFGSPVGTGELAAFASPSSVSGARLNWLWNDMTHW